MKRGLGVAVVLFIAGGLVGVAFSGAFVSFVQYSNTLGFCTSCHEMDIPFEQYKKTLHYKNPMGVRAVCSDCHVPHENWMETVLFKVKATRELIAHFTGRIDTKAKFEAHRKAMAEDVWSYLKATDSRTCRNCHSWRAMEFGAQRRSVRVEHVSARKAGKTCIDCHKGIAHEGFKPKEPAAAPSFQLQ